MEKELTGFEMERALTKWYKDRDFTEIKSGNDDVLLAAEPVKLNGIMRIIKSQNFLVDLVKKANAKVTALQNSNIELVRRKRNIEVNARDMEYRFSAERKSLNDKLTESERTKNLVIDMLNAEREIAKRKYFQDEQKVANAEISLEKAVEALETSYKINYYMSGKVAWAGFRIVFRDMAGEVASHIKKVLKDIKGHAYEPPTKD